MSNVPTSANSVLAESADESGSHAIFNRGYALLLHWVGLGCFGAGVFIALSTAYGMVVNFSPIPFMDQWDGYIGFWKNIQSGDYMAWWRQHNEHRIVFTRTLFWLDLKYFQGRNLLTIIANGVLHAATAAVFIYAYVRFASRRYSVLAVVGVVLALKLSWIQGENFTWGFQSQFIAVYLFAMLAFLALSTSIDQSSINVRKTVWAMLFGVLAAFSMTNGLLVLPLLVLQLVLLRASWKQFVPLITAGVVTWGLYFYGYKSPAGHGNPVEGLRHHLLGVLWYFTVFLGSPISFVMPGGVMAATAVGLTSGMSMAMLGGFLYLRNLFTPYRSMLYLTYVFCCASAFLAALGRYNFGIATAAAARYNTPALISWLCVFLIVIDLVSIRWFWRMVLLVSFCLMPAFVRYQLKVDDAQAQEERYWRAVGILSMKMGVNDARYMDWIYPRPMQPRLIELARYADAKQISIYAFGWVHNVGVIKFDASKADSRNCLGSFEGAEKIQGGYRLHGWASHTDAPIRGNGLILLADANGNTVGYGVTGDIRSDVRASVPQAGSHSGWIGYVINADSPVSAYYYDSQSFCKLANLVSFQSK